MGRFQALTKKVSWGQEIQAAMKLSANSLTTYINESRLGRDGIKNSCNEHVKGEAREKGERPRDGPDFEAFTLNFKYHIIDTIWSPTFLSLYRLLERHGDIGTTINFILLENTVILTRTPCCLFPIRKNQV